MRLALVLSLLLVATPATAVPVRDDFPPSWGVVVFYADTLAPLIHGLQVTGRYRDDGLVWWDTEWGRMPLPYVHLSWTDLTGTYDQADVAMPTPEPRTLLLVGSVLALLGWRRWRR